jgi:hypothetical protein
MNFKPIAAGMAGLLVLVACNRSPQPRRYSEVVTRGAGAANALTTESSLKIKWTLPDGWVEQAGGDPMRLASFLAPDPKLAHTGEMDPEALDISITQFSGAAGGAEANVSRWMGQLKIPAPLEEVKAFIAKAESLTAATGQRGILVDLIDHLGGDMTSTKGILGAIIPTRNATVFVKAMGDKGRLVKIRKHFIEFCGSLSVAEAAP